MKYLVEPLDDDHYGTKRVQIWREATEGKLQVCEAGGNWKYVRLAVPMKERPHRASTNALEVMEMANTSLQAFSLAI